MILAATADAGVADPDRVGVRGDVIHDINFLPMASPVMSAPSPFVPTFVRLGPDHGDWSRSTLVGGAASGDRSWRTAASAPPLLRRVSGITGGLAENIVAHRDAHGPFRTRRALVGVPRLGPKAFEQCAGFLRIPAGDDPLDRSGVHPDRDKPAGGALAAALRRAGYDQDSSGASH